MMRQAMAACRELVIWALVFGAGVNLLYLAPAVFMMQIYDRVLPSSGLATLGFISLALVFALLTLAFLDALRQRLAGRMSLKLDRKLAPILLELNMRRDSFGGDPRKAHVLREFDQFRAALTGPAANAIADAPWAPIYVLVCFAIHPWFGALALGGGVVLLLLAMVNGRALQTSLARANELTPRIYAQAESEAAAADAVGALGMRRALAQRQLDRREQLNSLVTDSLFGSSGYSAATKFLRLLLQSAALGVGAWLAVEREISPGALIAASILTARALAPLDQIVGAWRQISQARSSYRAVSEALKDIDTEKRGTRLPAPNGPLRFERVSVRMPATDRLVLADINFEAQPGEVLGIVGPSGAGKSTLARIACGALSPHAGAVRLDGANIADWDPDALGLHVGYLPQDVGLLQGTVAENIRRFAPLDRNGEMDVRTIEAAREAGAHEVIQRLPKGYDTLIGPNGRGLSFGQAQRVALARALFGEPALLVLDEPNAHLDGEGDTALSRAVEGAKQRGAIVLVVVQRPSVLANADRILVLRGGKVERIETRAEAERRIRAGTDKVTPISSAREAT